MGGCGGDDLRSSSKVKSSNLDNDERENYFPVRWGGCSTIRDTETANEEDRYHHYTCRGEEKRPSWEFVCTKHGSEHDDDLDNLGHRSISLVPEEKGSREAGGETYEDNQSHQERILQTNGL